MSDPTVISGTPARTKLIRQIEWAEFKVKLAFKELAEFDQSLYNQSKEGAPSA